MKCMDDSIPTANKMTMRFADSIKRIRPYKPHLQTTAFLKALLLPSRHRPTNLFTIFIVFLMLFDAGAIEAVTKRSLALAPTANNREELRLRLATEPTSLNPVDGANWNAGEIHNQVLESLLIQDPDSLAWRGRLADKWEKSADNREYTFHLRPGLVWSDGKPLTAHDVKFSFDAIFDDRFAAAQVRPYYQGIAGVDVVDAQTVRFRTNSSYFGNFISCAQMSMVPKHIYGNPADSEKLQTTVVGSGPYAFDVWQTGRMVRLKRNPKWWGWQAQVPESFNRPETVSFNFVTDDNVAIEMMRKGELDYTTLSSDEYRRLEGDANRGFQIERVRNLMPKNVKSLTFNLKTDLFQQKELRRALSFVIDRQMIVDRFYHGFMMPAAGPWYSQSEYADSEIEPDRYDPSRALADLEAAGWNDSDGDLILDRENDEGQNEKLKFTVLTFTPDDLRFMSVIREDARQVGIEIELRLVSEVVYNEAMRTGRFDAAITTRGASWVEFDPSVSWESKSLPMNGYNFGRYKNAAADDLIKKALAEPDFKKRVPMMQSLYRQIVDDAPELFLFNEQDSFYAVQDRVARPKATYNYEIGTGYWGLKSDSGPLRVSEAK